jgi:hypothetical protein
MGATASLQANRCTLHEAFDSIGPGIRVSNQGRPLFMISKGPGSSSKELPAQPPL